MKIKFLILFFTFTFLGANAQEIVSTPRRPVLYLGVGTGLNSYTGVLGISGNLRLHKKTFIQAGLGIGSWGSKYSVGFRYDLDYNSGWSFGVGVSNCTGISNMNLDMELYNGDTKSVKVHLKSARTLNLTATHNWRFGRKNNVYVDMGYAVPLQTSPWEITDGSIISEDSRETLNLISPGGVILGLGVTFGL